MTHSIDHVTNAAALVFVKGLRSEINGYYAVYTSRYIAALEEVTGAYVATKGVEIAGNKRDKIVTVVTLKNGFQKEFNSAKEAGTYLEKTIDSMYELGILA